MKGKSFNKLLALVFLATMVISCSSSGPTFKLAGHVPKEVATIYIYRPFMTYNMAGWPDIYINGKKEFALKNNAYNMLQLTPGKHEIKAKGSKHLTDWFPKPVSLKFDFVAGEEYFVRVLPKFTDSMSIGSVVAVSGSAQISIIPKQAALKEISETTRTN